MLVLDVAGSTMAARYLSLRCSVPGLLLLLQGLCLAYSFFGFPWPGDHYPGLYPGEPGPSGGAAQGGTRHGGAAVWLL